ncbi:MAG: hypothetical protein V9G12_19555 [Microthrixaceae bacterium]
MALGAIGSLCADSQHAFFRAGAPEADGYPRFSGFDPTPPDAYFRSITRGVSCATIGCRAPMAAASGDLDGDQHFDTFIAFDPFHSVFRGSAAPPWQDLTVSMPFREIPGSGPRSMLAWGSAMLDLDGDGRDDIVSVHGDDDGSAYDLTLSIGPQCMTVFWNAGAMRFDDLTSAAHLDAPGQWRSLSVRRPRRRRRRGPRRGRLRRGASDLPQRHRRGWPPSRCGCAVR